MLYLNFSFLDFENNQFANKFLRSCIKSNSNFFTILAFFYIFILKLAFILNIQISKYINKNLKNLSNLF